MCCLSWRIVVWWSELIVIVVVVVVTKTWLCGQGRAACQSRVFDLELVERLGLVGPQVDFQSIVGLGQRILRTFHVSIQLVGGLVVVNLVCCKWAHRGTLDTQVLPRSKLAFRVALPLIN